MKTNTERRSRSTKIKNNDMVKVVSGRDRGKVAKVLKVFPVKGTAIVENINFVKKATRPNPGRNVKGGIITKEADIRISSLMIVCPQCNKPTRVAIKRLENGTRTRLCKKCDAMIDK
jgi:large subunit ribosomal protein L24